MVFALQIILNGVATGAIYALVAVGYSLTFTGMRVLNFGLGMWVMLGGMLTYTLYVLWGLNIALAAPIVIVALTGLGVICERFTVRPFLKAGSEAWVMATLAVGLLFIDLAELIWGRDPLRVPGYLGQAVVRFGAFGLYPQQILIVACTIAVFFGLDFFYYRTLPGRAFRAVAHDPEVAELMGIDARKFAALSYGAACGLGGFAGLMVAPVTLVDPQMGTTLGLKAFVVPILAGLAAPRGILVCGLAYGVLEGLVSGYLFSGLRDILACALMILILYFRPEGLFGEPSVERI
jgi:branched-chain amino acid transport system permease protein